LENIEIDNLIDYTKIRIDVAANIVFFCLKQEVLGNIVAFDFFWKGAV